MIELLVAAVIVLGGFLSAGYVSEGSLFAAFAVACVLWLLRRAD